MKKFLAILIVASMVSVAVFAGTTDGNAGYGVAGLKPNHQYVICINGYKDHESNKTLLKIGERWESTGEGYIDYARANTDDTGNLSPALKKDLPGGAYKVKFLVKDPDSKWKVVWNVDEIEFNVK